MLRKFLYSVTALSMSLGLASCSSETEPVALTPADTVLLNGKIYTVDATRSWADAVAIKDGKFIAVGTDKDVRVHIGDKTEIIDLNGKFGLPGFHDTHIHIASGDTVFRKGYCKLPDSNSNVTAEELYKLIEVCRDTDPEATGWFIGGGWPGGAFPPDGAPDKEPLDTLFPDRPAFLRADSGHLAWVNSKALELAGITNDTPNPENGEIQRDPVTGEATGTLFESAEYLVAKLIPPLTQTEKDSAIYRAFQHANSMGITAIFDAAVQEEDLQTFGRLYKSNRLPVHLRTSLWGGTENGKITPASDLKALADKYRSAGIKTDAVKLMLDGVMEGATAAQIHNYIGHDHAGAMFVTPDVLTKSLIELDAAGLQVKMHGYGRLAVREGLNAVEAAIKANGNNGLRHHIDHLAQVHPDDYDRFGALPTIAGFSPLWAMPNSYETELARPILGDKRWIDSYPIASIEKLGGTFISGSDWPVSMMNPFPSIATGITRKDPMNPDRAPLNTGESASLDSLIASYTINAAYVMHQEDKTGSIEVGKSADLIILDRNLFDIAPAKIWDTKVLRTFFKGQAVYVQD